MTWRSLPSLLLATLPLALKLDWARPVAIAAAGR